MYHLYRKHRGDIQVILIYLALLAFAMVCSLGLI